MIEAHWERARLLFEQQRWDLAEKELRAALAIDPEFSAAYAMLGIVLAQTGSLDEALAEARQAITVDPESDFGYHAIAVVFVARRDLDEAAKAIAAAIDIDPEHAGYRGMLAQIRFHQERWEDALQAADTGLAIDPHDTGSLNLRSLALTKLGRGKEATASVETSLAHDPENPYTHQALGFAKLHQGDAKQALTHFQEALRRDPTLDGAREGMLEALKARNPIYRMVLGWFLWLERFEPKRRTQILIGIWIGTMFFRRMLDQAGYENAAVVVGFSWLGFVLLTACAVPIFNLLLLLHPIGRHALARSSRNSALLLGAALLAAISVWTISLAGDVLWANGSRLFSLIYLLPVAGLGLFANGWAQRVMQTICVSLLGAWIWWVYGAIDLTAEIEAVKLGLLDTPENAARAQRLLASGEVLASLRNAMTWTAVLSTWFVLFAPKGHQNRRR
jgi:Flp pilus assembly protein TadD